VARCQASWGSSAKTCLALVVVCTLYVVVRAVFGAEVGGALTAIIVIVGLSAAYLLFAQRRHVFAAGPGWLSSREFIATRWVRTDRLVKLAEGASGIERVLTFVDDEGRRVGLTRTDLQSDAALTAQVRVDVTRSLERGLDANMRALAILGLDSRRPS
jgi:hypothetical protein